MTSQQSTQPSILKNTSVKSRSQEHQKSKNKNVRATSLISNDMMTTNTNPKGKFMQANIRMETSGIVSFAAESSDNVVALPLSMTSRKNQEETTLQTFMNEIWYQNNHMSVITEPLRKKQMLEFVDDLCVGHGLRLKYEKKKCVGVDKVTEKATEKSAEKSSKYSFLLDGQYTIDRIVITKYANEESSWTLLSYDANGLILDTDTWKVLSISTTNFNHQVKLSLLKQMIACASLPIQATATSAIPKLNTYKIYPILDGTTVSLYCRNPKEVDRSLRTWCFSSANSWEVDNYKWIGPKTYAEILKELLMTYNIDVQSCSPTTVYILSFSHNDFHPFVNTKQSVTVLETFNTVTLTRSMTCDLPIPVQSSVDLSGRMSTTGPSIINDIMNNNKNSLSEFITTATATVSNMSVATASAVTTSMSTTSQYPLSSLAQHHAPIPFTSNHVNHGYIIKFVETSDANLPMKNVILESELMKRIRKSIYDLNNYMMTTQNIELNNTTRESFIVLKAYLDVQHREEFRVMFPRYQTLFQQYEQLFNDVIKGLIYKYRKCELDQSLSQQTVALVNTFEKILQENEKIFGYDHNTKSLLEDHLFDVKNIPIIWNVIYG